MKRFPILFVFILLYANNSFSQYCPYSSLASKPNLVVNGDFESDNTGFTSQYTYIPSTTLLYEEKYTFTTNAHLVHFAWTGPSRTGTGKFMAINGAGIPLFFWNETITVRPNTNYRFSTWLKNLAIKPQYQGLAPAKIELWINNQKVSNTITLVDYPDVWKLLDTIWNSGSNTTALLGIKTVSTDGNGCDFGMDDVEFKECTCTSTSLSATNPTTICLGDSIQLNATPSLSGGTYSWSPGNSLNDSTLKSPIGKPVTNTTYAVTYTLAGCSTTTNVPVNVTQIYSNAGLDKNICLGDSIQLNGLVIGTFKWQPSTFLNNPNLTRPYCKPNTNIDYILTATNGTCVQSDTVSVSIFTSASANAGADQRICAGAGVMLNASTASTYEWTPAYFITNSNSQTPFVNPPMDTTYYLKISVGYCIGFDTVKVKVVPIPTVIASDDTKVCVDDSVQLNAQVSNPSKWVWRSQVQLSDSSILNPKAKIAQHSVFIIIVSDTSKLCFASDTMIVDPYPVVKAIYSADNYSGEGQLKPVFDNTSQNATKYTWLFGDSLNTSSKDKNPDFTFIKPGIYKVKLLAQNDYGCKDSITKEFTVLPAGKLYIPNAFTPNGDMYNEVFKFVYPESVYKRVEMTIYNRWGGFIYETSMPGGKWWDGTFEGVPCSEDVYFYVAKAIKINGEISDYHGTITLLR